MFVLLFGFIQISSVILDRTRTAVKIEVCFSMETETTEVPDGKFDKMY